MSAPYRPFRRHRRGLTLIEAAMVLAVVALVFGGFAQLINDASENLKSRNAAERIREIAKVSESYVNARLAQIRQQPVGTVLGIPITGAGQLSPGFPSLTSGGYLPSNYKDFTPYGQNHILLVKVSAPPTGSSQNRVEALVTSLIQTPAAVIPLRQRGRVVQFIGARGGFCQGAANGSNGCTRITGAAGGWLLTPSDWNYGPYPIAAGSVQQIVPLADSAALSDYLSRNDIGVPEANTMRTTILSATNPGDYALEADPSTGNTVLKIGPDVQVPGKASIGASLKVEGAGCANEPDSGSIVACNNIIAGHDMVAGHDINAANDVRGNRFIDNQDPNRLVDPAGRSNLRNINITDMLVTTDDGNDRLNSNQSVRLRDLLPRYVAKDGFTPSKDSPWVELPVCPSGGQARVFLSSMQESYQIDLERYIKAQRMPGYVYNVNGATNPVQDQGAKNVSCSGGGCSVDYTQFVKPDGLTHIQGIAEMNLGKISNFRQYVAGSPQYLNLGDPRGPLWYWKVDMPSAAGNLSDNAITEPLPWKALAMTYCYY